VLQPLKGIFSPTAYPDLLVGLDAPDDAAVYRVAPDRAIISTVDFFPPVVDDPYTFGAVAAANALSDIYAMGGEPLFAVNLVAYPDGLGLDILTEILRGGAEKVREAGAVVAGGHTVTDREPKYGLAVTGTVHPDRIVPKGGAQDGDILILTKALGTGTITTALKQGRASETHVAAAVAAMMHLNRAASACARLARVHAMTDITGFGLLGHAHEMAHLAGADFSMRPAALRWIDGARDYAAAGIFPGGMARNRDFYSQWVDLGVALPPTDLDLLYDPQTSGGLLMAVHPDDATSLMADLAAHGEQAALVGTVHSGTGRLILTG
jgi:selenide,water dikinase